jgi:hypothetical protein
MQLLRVQHAYSFAIRGNGLFLQSPHVIFLLPSGSERNILAFGIIRSCGILLTIAAAAASTILERCAPASTSGRAVAPADLERRNGSSFITRALRSRLRSNCRRGVVSSLSGLLSGLKRLRSSAEEELTILASLIVADVTSGTGWSESCSSVLFVSCGFHPIVMRLFCGDS